MESNGLRSMIEMHLGACQDLLCAVALTDKVG